VLRKPAGYLGYATDPLAPKACQRASWPLYAASFALTRATPAAVHTAAPAGVGKP
jgi:hypothetical protein